MPQKQIPKSSKNLYCIKHTIKKPKVVQLKITEDLLPSHQHRGLRRKSQIWGLRKQTVGSFLKRKCLGFNIKLQEISLSRN